MKTIKEINIPEIDISEIDAKSKEIEENINYDEVRNRIRQVLDKITDKKNRGKKVSQSQKKKNKKLVKILSANIFFHT